jgi:hypothetical protein
VSLSFHFHRIGELRLDSLLVFDASWRLLMSDSVGLSPIFPEGY